jgi:hypothetical protein
MVYYDLDEAQDTMNALTGFLISRIPEEAPPAIITPLPPPPPVLVRKEDEKVPVKEESSSGSGFFTSIAWAPFLPIYGQENAEFDESFNLTGGILKLGFVPSHSRIGSFGLELGITYNFLGKNPEWALELGSLLNIGLSFIYQTPRIKNFLIVKITLGGGGGMMFEKFDLFSGGPWSPVNQNFVPNAAAGLSFIMLFGQHFFIDAGGAFTMYFPKDFPDRSLGLISPRIGFGWRAN